MNTTCTTCSGTGRDKPEQTCPACEGTGLVAGVEEVKPAEEVEAEGEEVNEEK